MYMNIVVVICINVNKILKFLLKRLFLYYKIMNKILKNMLVYG